MQGTTFSQVYAETTRVQARPRVDTARPCVLIVDDDPALRRLVSMALSMAHFNVLEAGSALDAMALLERSSALALPEEQVRLVLLDVMMPGMDGLTLCRRIKKDFAVPVIMVTARSAAADLDTAVQSGADGYVIKPFDIKALLDKVTQCMQKPTVTLSNNLPGVLIVDDDPGIRKLMGIILRRQYTVLEASKAEEAWEHLERSARIGASMIRTVLLDVMLPQVDGLTLCQMIKKEFDVRVVIVTARAAPDDIRAAVGAGADDYLAKPFNYQSLLDKVARQSG